MVGHDIIVMGASAGGIEALTRVLHGFPADLPAAVFVVQHLAQSRKSVLPRILGDAGRLPVEPAVDGATFTAGRVYVAPPRVHLVLRAGLIQLVSGPRENGHRPAVDPLFRSAAAAYGPRVIGVVLSGALDCGAAGLVAIARAGGITVVQDPKDALYADMPRHALAALSVDHCAAAADLGPLLARLVHTRPREVTTPPTSPVRGDPSRFSCPECGGVLDELPEMAFRCQVGHRYSATALDHAQDDAVDAALWAALRALEEKLVLNRRLVARARDRGMRASARRFDERAEEIECHARLLRQVLTEVPPPLQDDDEDPRT